MDDLKAILDAATPGPWFCNEDPRDGMEWNIHIHHTDEDRICFMSNMGQKRSAENAANARLIAMAPDLAAEVVRLRKALGLYANPQNWKMSGPCDPNGPNFIGEEHARAALEGRDK